MRTHESSKFTCEKCDEFFPMEDILKKHVSEVHEGHMSISCEFCSSKFTSNSEMEKHKKTVHTNAAEPEQWNCNDCAFQANCASELMNHLKHMGHAPSKAEKDTRQTFRDFKQCYTCKREFDGYWNLMTHKKQAHPSKRKCRNFPGNCPHGIKCWFVHEEKMEIDKEEEKDETKKNNPPEKQVFQQVAQNLFPPDQMSKMFWMVNNLVTKVENMEKRFENMEKRFEEIMI